jgi:hypothetical protein
MRNFKFFNMWASHDQFLEVVSNHWSYVVYDTPMYVFCRRLKLLKRHLKELNRLHFSHIFEHVLRLETELADHQSILQHDRDNHLLLEHEKPLQSKLSTLKFAKKQFFSQKIKCNFLKDSDRGSKFFHALMNHNHRRNFIPAIMTTHGQLSSSLEEVGAVFVHYFQQLLGTFKITIPLDDAVIHSRPYLSSSSHDLLLSPVTHEDIWKAVFSIGDDKAPRPDGYSSLFFKQAWHVVGEDLSAAVQDFFFFLEGSLGRLIIQSLLWFPNQPMFILRLISGQSLATM